MPKITENELLLIAKSTQETLRNFTSGATFVGRAGVSIKDLQFRVANQRIRLARALLRDAKSAAASVPPMNRTVVSRAYYAMYHAARAATYISFGGDDHEQHSVLPTKFPADFPNADAWRNSLKNARLERNRADYDPYPKLPADLQIISERLVVDATKLVAAAQKYISAKK